LNNSGSVGRCSGGRQGHSGVACPRQGIQYTFRIAQAVGKCQLLRFSSLLRILDNES
jgi:hypothetical protein